MPVGVTEEALVREMASCHWRLQRARGYEARILERLYEDPATTNPVDAFAASQKEIDQVRRYMVTLERGWYKAINTLRMLQKDRATAEKRAAESEAANVAGSGKTVGSARQTAQRKREEDLSDPDETDDESLDSAEMEADNTTLQAMMARLGLKSGPAIKAEWKNSGQPLP